MASINRVYISEWDSSINPISWPLTCEHLGVLCTNSSM